MNSPEKLRVFLFVIAGLDPAIQFVSKRFSNIERSDLLFAYVHGSSVAQEQFRDIDVAIYLKSKPIELLQLELNLEAELYNLIGCPADIRILNDAPLSFRYNVIRQGRRLAVLTDDARCDFEETMVNNYFDFAPYRKMYLQEALGRGVDET